MQKARSSSVRGNFPEPREAETSDTGVLESPRSRRRIRWVAKPRASATRSHESALPLSTRAISCLVQRMPRQRGVKDGNLEEMLVFGGRLSPVRMLRIAASCTRAELLATRGVGVGTVDEIEEWLEAHGHRFRTDPDGVTSALRKAIEHLEALVETREDDAYLRAFLALPELKKALRTAPGQRSQTRSVYRTASTKPADKL